MLALSYETQPTPNLSLVVWLPHDDTREELAQHLQDQSSFVVRAAPRTREEFVQAVATFNPDAIVIGAPQGYDGELRQTLLRACRGAILPAVAIVPSSYRPTSEDRKTAARLNATLLTDSLLFRQDDAARQNVAFRLESFAMRVSAGRAHTLSSHVIADAVMEIRSASRVADVSPVVVDLAGKPTDLLLLLGDPVAVHDLANMGDRFTPPRLPIMIALKGLTAAETAEVLSTPIPTIQPAPAHGSIRGLRGVFAVDWAGLRIRGDRFANTSEPGTRGGPLREAASLGKGLVAVQLSHRELDLNAHSYAQVSGCTVATLRSADCHEPHGARVMEQHGLATAQFSRTEFGWFIEHVVPRRG